MCNPEKTIFIDFDGTITRTDTCAAMVEAFAADGWEEINRLWEEKKISTEECANLTFQLFKATPEEIGSLMLSMEVDEFFGEFLSHCREKGYKAFILSDGYDLNIRTILQKHGLDIEFYCNELLYDRDSGFSIRCPYSNPSCGNCGTCKRTLMDRLKTEGSQAVYIGDGHSDMCPAAAADIVFAKGVLYRYCVEQSIAAIPFDNFSDILNSGFI